MWSLIFASKARLSEQLAVERATRVLREEQLADARERLAKSERQFDRLRDQVLAKQGVIHSPLADTPRPPALPLAGVMSAFGVTEFDPDEPSALRAPMHGS